MQNKKANLYVEENDRDAARRLVKAVAVTVLMLLILSAFAALLSALAMVGVGADRGALIMLFYLTGYGMGIGFLIAAKSILRYGEIRSHYDKKRAQYIIIGTLLSFTLGILVAVVTRYVVGKV